MIPDIFGGFLKLCRGNPQTFPRIIMSLLLNLQFPTPFAECFGRTSLPLISLYSMTTLTHTYHHTPHPLPPPPCLLAAAPSSSAGPSCPLDKSDAASATALCTPDRTNAIHDTVTSQRADIDHLERDCHRSDMTGLASRASLAHARVLHDHISNPSFLAFTYMVWGASPSKKVSGTPFTSVGGLSASLINL